MTATRLQDMATQFGAMALVCILFTIWHIGCFYEDPILENEGGTTLETNTVPVVGPLPSSNPVCRIEGQRILAPDGDPVFFIADTAWELCDDLGESDIISYMKVRKTQGFNTIIISTSGGWWIDAVTPRMKLWDRLSFAIDAARELELYIIVNVHLTEYDQSNGGFVPYLRLPKTAWRKVGEWVGARYKDDPTVMFWMVGGLDDRIVPVESLTDMAAGLKATDTNHIVSFHPKRTTIQAIPLGPNHQLALYQSHQETDVVVISNTLMDLSETGVPFADIEPIYEGKWRSCLGTPMEVENVAAACSRLNVCGMAYGHHDIQPFTPNWREALDAPGAALFLKQAARAIGNH